jgi:hypothetical protein
VLLYDFFQLDRPFDEVARLLADGEAWLGPLADRATADGRELQVRIGLSDGPWAPGKQFRVRLGERYERDGMIGIPMRWEATGPKGLFPLLDGDLEIVRLGPDCTHVALQARYDPPLGSIGRLLDRNLLHHVAEASIRSFLRHLERALLAAAASVPQP